MPDEQVLLTAEGKAKLQAELDQLIAKRPEVAEQIAATRDGSTMLEGDTALEELMRQQGQSEGRIQELQRILAHAQLIGDERRVSEEVRLGNSVTVVDPEGKELTYRIVGSVEADALAGRISNISPVGSALMGRHPGDTVEVRAPAGTMKLKIKSVQ